MLNTHRKEGVEEMKRAILAALTATAVGMIGDPASAQEWSWDFGIHGGASYFTPSLDDDQLGADQEDLKYKLGWNSGLHLGWWPHPRFGIRANGGYSERAMKQGDTDPITEDHNHWDITGDLMIRLSEVPEEFMGREFLPYLALGAGIKHINPAEDVPLDDGNEGVVFGVSATSFSTPVVIDEENKFQALVALGGDWRFRPNMALRLEVGDRIWDTPIHFAVPTGSGSFRRDPPGDENIGNWVHQIYGNIGLNWLFGLAAVPEPVVVTPPPAPPAPTPPPPAPTTRDITVCVVDPSSGTGLRTVNATYRIEQRDTMVNGQPIRTAVGPVMVATQADWYIAGRPMALTVDRNTTEFVTYGGARVIGASDLEFLGTVNGLPVYASRNDVGDIREELAELRGARNSNDLAQILEEEDELREELEELDVVYVPLQPVGCVFQGLQRVEQVRKVRGQ